MSSSGSKKKVAGEGVSLDGVSPDKAFKRLEKAVGAALESQGLVRDARSVRGLARWRGLENRLQVGEFALSPAMTPEEILDKVVSGKVVTYEVTVPEGFTLEKIAERLAEAGLVERDAFLAVAPVR